MKKLLIALAFIFAALTIPTVHGLDMTLQETLTDAEENVQSVAYSPDGNYVAYAGNDYNVYIHDTDTYTLQETLTEADAAVQSIDYSPDGNYVAYGGNDGNVYIHDTDTYTLQETFTEAPDVKSLSYSPDGSHIAYSSEDSNVYIHDTDTYTLQETLTAAGDRVWSLAYSPDGDYIAYGSWDGGNVYIHDTDTYTLQETLTEEGMRVISVTYSPDGHIAYGGYDSNVYIHDTDTYTLQETLTDAGDRVWSIAYSPDGSYIAHGSSDDNVYIHDTDTYTLQETLTAAGDRVETVTYSPDSEHIAYGSYDTNVYIHDSITYEEFTVTFEDYDGTILDEQIVVEGDDAAAPDDPTRDGYTFDGWDGDYTDITEDTTITATYLENYTVTFEDYDGTILDEQSVAEGNDALPPDDPTRYGYTFEGWDGDTTTITEDTTITATYTVSEYTVIFEGYDGTLLDEQTVEHGSDAAAPDAPYREGYRFDSWDTDTTNITEDTTITATYDDVRTAQEVINDWLATVGLDGPFGSMFVVVVIMIGVSFMAAINHAPLPVLILINLILLLLAVLLGFIPAWVLIGLAMAIMLMIYIVLTDIPIGGGNE